MPQKSKCSPEEKIKIVEDCLNQKISRNAATKKYGIGWDTLSSWIRLYESRGAEGLIPATHLRTYSPETKVKSVKAYLAGEGSLAHICKNYDISCEKMLRNWIKQYNSHGCIIPQNNGGKKHMAKGRATTLDERVEIVSYCIAQNKDYYKTIELHGVSYQQIYAWVRKYEASGVDGLIDCRGKRKSQSTMSDVDRLHAQLKLKDAENRRLQMENDLLKKLAELERG